MSAAFCRRAPQGTWIPGRMFIVGVRGEHVVPGDHVVELGGVGVAPIASHRRSRRPPLPETVHAGAADARPRQRPEPLIHSERTSLLIAFRHCEQFLYCHPARHCCRLSAVPGHPLGSCSLSDLGGGVLDANEVERRADSDCRIHRRRPLRPRTRRTRPTKKLPVGAAISHSPNRGSAIRCDAAATAAAWAVEADSLAAPGFGAALHCPVAPTTPLPRALLGALAG